MTELFANSRDTDQRLHSVASVKVIAVCMCPEGIFSHGADDSHEMSCYFS